MLLRAQNTGLTNFTLSRLRHHHHHFLYVQLSPALDYLGPSIPRRVRLESIHSQQRTPPPPPPYPAPSFRATKHGSSGNLGTLKLCHLIHHPSYRRPRQRPLPPPPTPPRRPLHPSLFPSSQPAALPPLAGGRR